MNRLALHPLCDPEQVVKDLSLILRPGQVTELRILEGATVGDRYPQTWSGYFDDPAKLAGSLGAFRSWTGAYFIPNLVNPALLSRAANRVRPAKKNPLTNDGDVDRRLWLMIDVDANRPAGISSTEEEHQAAIDCVLAIESDLAVEGWYAGIAGDSGNGAHLLYPIDLESQDDGRVQRCLEALSARYSDAIVTIDTTTSNAARIWKLYGTLACKGDDTPDRPHRPARIIQSPDVLTPIPLELVEELASKAPTATKTISTPRPSTNGNGRVNGHKLNGHTFDLAEWIRTHRLDVEGPRPWTSAGGGSGQKWVLRVCPWNPDHTNGSAFIVQFSNGAIDAGCHHNGCKGRDWHALRDLVEPGWRNSKAFAGNRPISSGDGRHHASPVTGSSRRPTRSEPEQYKPFPLDALPPVMSDFAAEAGRTLCVDPVMAVLPMLTIAGACIGNAARARLSSDYHAPPNIWSMPLTRSGERKSPVLRAVMRPIHESQADRAKDHAEAVAEYEGKMEQWKAKPKNERGDRPVEPGDFPHLYLSQCTTEAIAVRLAQQPRGLPVVMDELSALFTGMNQYRAKGGSDRECYLAFYDANAAKIDRKGSAPPVIFIPRAFVAVTGMCQPGVLARVIGGGDYDSGMIARFILAAPPPQKAAWTDRGIPDAVRDGWRDLLLTLLAHPLPDDPVLIPLSDDAMRRWAATHDRMDAERHAERNDRVRAARAKLIGTIPRLALILQMVSSASGEHGAAVRVIDDTSMRRAVEIVEWCSRETRRVYGVLSDDSGDDDVLGWVADRGGSVTPRELRARWRMFRPKGAAEDYLESLVHDGTGRWEWRTTGGRPSRVFVLLFGGIGTETPDSSMP